MPSEISPTEEDKRHMTSHMWHLKTVREKTKLIQRTDQRLSETRGPGEGTRGEGGKEVQTSSYRINKSRRCGAQHSDYS